jgi:hypothetical protein
MVPIKPEGRLKFLGGFEDLVFLVNEIAIGLWAAELRLVKLTI